MSTPGIPPAVAPGRRPARRDRPKYLGYGEAEAVYRRLTGASVLAIYQHLQPNAHKREGDLRDRCQRLSQELDGRRVWAIHSGDLAFVICPCPTADGNKLAAALAGYARRVDMNLLNGVAPP